jgi:hypothetical protein
MWGFIFFDNGGLSLTQPSTKAELKKSGTPA